MKARIATAVKYCCFLRKRTQKQENKLLGVFSCLISILSRQIYRMLKEVGVTTSTRAYVLES